MLFHIAYINEPDLIKLFFIKRCCMKCRQYSKPNENGIEVLMNCPLEGLRKETAVLYF